MEHDNDRKKHERERNPPADHGFLAARKSHALPPSIPNTAVVLTPGRLPPSVTATERVSPGPKRNRSGYLRALLRVLVESHPPSGAGPGT